MRQQEVKWQRSKRTQDKTKSLNKKGCFLAKEQSEVTDENVPEGYKMSSIWDQKPCSNCGALKFPNESEGFCCANGKFKIDQLEMPPQLKNLLENDTDFVKNIRLYNNALCLATWGVEGGKVTDEWSNFKFQGRCYHRIGPLRPEDGDDRRWAQWYIHDGTAEEEAQGRIDSMPEGARCRLKKETVKVLQDMLHEVNSLVKGCKMMTEIEEEHPERVQEMKFLLTETGRPAGAHERTYNLPASDEVALVKLDDSLEPGDVQIYLRGGGVRRINHMNRKSDSLHYILLFPQGQDTWHKDLMKSNNKRVTSAEYYRHIFQVFDKQFNGILR